MSFAGGKESSAGEKVSAAGNRANSADERVTLSLIYPEERELSRHLERSRRLRAVGRAVRRQFQGRSGGCR